MKCFATLIVLAFALPAMADDNIVIVFDTSGSMGYGIQGAGESRMKVAQDALISVLSKVPTTTKVGILTFENWIYDLQKVDSAKVEKAIRKCMPGGGTPLYQYTKMGGDRLLQERAKQGNVGYYKLIVVTDGEAQDNYLNRDSTFSNGNFKPGVLKDIISRNIIVDAIGIAMSNDHALKNQINGQYMRGDDPKSIEFSLKKAVAEVGFSGKDDISEEAFQIIAGLPDSFVKDSIKGLTEYRNHPIGEQGVVDAVNIEGAEKPSVSGWSYWWLFWLIMGVVIVGVLIIVFATGK